MAQSEELFQDAMNQGHSAAWDQSWEQAIEHYHQALQVQPDHPAALTSLGLAYFELQRYEEAIEYYSKAAKVNPDDPLPMERLSHIHEAQGKNERAVKEALQAADIYLKTREAKKAIENWTRVIQLKPESLQAHSRLALVYERLEQKQQAVRELLILASLYQHANDVNNAAQVVQRAQSILPDSKEARRAQEMIIEGQMLPLPTSTREISKVDKRKKPPRAEEAAPAIAVKGLDPVEEAHQKALGVLAEFLFESSVDSQPAPSSKRGLQALISGARGVFGKPVDRSRVHAHLNLMVELHTRGDEIQAAGELEHALDAGLDHPAGYYELGYLRTHAERLESAVRSFQHAVHHPDFAIGARLMSGQNLRRIGRIGEATSEHLRALQEADSQIVAEERADELRQLYEPIIEAQSRKSDPKEQEQVCDSISRILMRPDWRDQLSLVREQLPSIEAGAPLPPVAEILLEASSSQVVDLLNNIYSLARQGYLRSAMEEAFHTLQFMPTYLPLHLYMGELLLKQEQFEEAIAKFMVVAHSYQTRGEPRRAIELYQRIIRVAPMVPEPRGKLINLLLSLDMVEQALEEYIRYAEVFYNLADLQKARQTYQEALKLTQKSKKADTWRVSILHRLADIDLQSLDWPSAMHIFEQIREINPGDEKACANLVELKMRLGHEKQALAEFDRYLLYVKESGRAKGALKYFENLIQDNPEKPGFRLRLAELYQLAGRLPDAIKHLDAAGDLLLEAGDKAGAIAALERILTLKPDNAAQYQKLLKQIRGEK